MASKKSYKLVGSNEKPVGAGNCCSDLSWFGIISFILVSLILVCLLPSMFFPYGGNLTSDVLRSERNSPPVNVKENPSVESLDKQQPVEKSGAESSRTYQYAQESDAESSAAEKPNVESSDNRCAGKYIYVTDLSNEFNSDLLLTPWADACKLLANSGFGPLLNISDDRVFSGSNWFETNQFSLEVIFHSRMKQYRCLTNNYSETSAVFVPFYPSLDLGRYLGDVNDTVKDATSIKLVEYLREKPEWRRYGGRDHFLIVGRTSWDFRKPSVNTSGWGNHMFLLPEMTNMTSLLIESCPTTKSEIAIPYPTYFHPSSGYEVQSWQDSMRQKERPYLFSFAGAPRPYQKSIRNVIIKECADAEGNHCKFVNCNVTADCEPEAVMRLFQSSDFCLQPPGDSFTRRSIFDTILAGCIPVLFHPGSAYVQYVWHLPKNYTSYSVFIPADELMQGKVSIEKRLLEIPKEKVLAMREEVIKLIPRIVYANQKSKTGNFEDGFDVAVKEVLNRVQRFKMETEGGRNAATYESIPDELAWKYNFFGDLENHEWDNYF